MKRFFGTDLRVINPLTVLIALFAWLVAVSIILNVLPTVNLEANSIVMKLHPEVSDVAGFRNDAPIITTRQADTIVEVKDGETVVIGGLLRDEILKSQISQP